MNSNLISVKVLILFVSLGLLSLQASATEENEGWIQGQGELETTKGFRGHGIRSWWFRKHPEESDSIQIKTDGRHYFDKRTGLNQQSVVLRKYSETACFRIYSTPLSSIFTVPKMTRCIYSKGCLIYPKGYISVACLPREQYVERKKEEQKILIEKERNRAKERAKNEIRNERRRKEQEEEKKQLAASSLAAKKTECTAFGFEPETPDHAECVMKMAIAEKARNKSESQANAIAEESAAAAAAYQAQIRRVQAQQAAANREAREAAKRQREAQLLINLGGAISSGQFPGGSSSGPAFSDEPMPSSGRYKECFYRVAGDRLSVSIPRAEGCPATRTFGSVTGYLTR